jgi:S1-C subfamily serine protease
MANTLSLHDALPIYLAVQIDAKTHYGNAGGPVVDLQGRFMGLVTQVGPRKVWAPSSGVGFYAPAERILAVLEDLRAGRVLRQPPQAFLGVAPGLGETDLEGVRLATVVENSPAWQAGLRENDILTRLDGQPTRSWSAVLRLLKAHAASDTCRLQAVRDGRAFELRVTLDERKP